MVLAYNDIMELLRVLSEDRNLRVTVTESGKGALVAGGVAGIGGLVLGPIGLALGGSIGGCLAAYMGQGKFKPLALVIMEDIKDEQRVQMVNAVRAIVDNIDAGDAMTLVAIVSSNEGLRNRVITEMVTFLSRQCNIYVNE
eukprot:TRINITY_DN26376_c0_g1_i2.p1 TRINITY_DN26376_c0_g1~~TRINITY_DN26376_c0_g1_i2.p1  ORF type:complete len:141 (-),score=43.94 TRINITY_DN26376_c0_g1_i2:183-605(-)